MKRFFERRMVTKPFLIHAEFESMNSGIIKAVLLLTLIISAPIAGQQSAESLYIKSFQQDDVTALRTLVRAKKLDEKNVAVLFRIGFLLHKMNRWSEASEYYEMALEIAPCHSRAINNLAGIAFASHRLDKAQKLYIKSVSCNDNFYLPHYNLGNIYSRKGEMERAIEEYNRSLELNSEHAATHLNLGVLLGNLARRLPAENPDRIQGFQEALKHVAFALREKKRDPVAHLQYAVLLADISEYDRAYKHLDEAVRFARGNNSMEARIHDQRKRIQNNQRVEVESQGKREGQIDSDKTEKETSDDDGNSWF